MDVLSSERQEDLSGASELPEAAEDQPGCFLDPQVRIQTQSDLPMPYVANRHRNPQLSSPRLRTGGVEHPRAQDAQLELADATLHAQEQPVVGATRIIDTVEIDHAGLDEPAKFQKVMPVAAVPGEPGGVEAENRADLTGAQPSDELLKSRPGDRPARGAAQIVVDHFDVPKAPSPGLIHEFILSALALQVDLDLGLRRLANVDHGLPLENGGR